MVKVRWINSGQCITNDQNSLVSTKYSIPLVLSLIWTPVPDAGVAADVTRKRPMCFKNLLQPCTHFLALFMKRR